MHPLMPCAMTLAILGVPATVSCGQEEQASAASSTRSNGGRIELEPPTRLKAGDAVIDTVGYVGHAGPMQYDFDLDGVPDLVVGNFAGHFQLYRNAGSAKAPLYESRGLLKADGETVKVPNW